MIVSSTALQWVDDLIISRPAELYEPLNPQKPCTSETFELTEPLISRELVELYKPLEYLNSLHTAPLEPLEPRNSLYP